MGCRRLLIPRLLFESASSLADGQSTNFLLAQEFTHPEAGKCHPATCELHIWSINRRSILLLTASSIGQNLYSSNKNMRYSVEDGTYQLLFPSRRFGKHGLMPSTLHLVERRTASATPVGRSSVACSSAG
jgi:hypothetical protein